jgi:PST family polysaccharide transporter
MAERAHAAELATTASRGARAILATRVLSLLATAASVTVLPRLIGPADFGVWAMAGLVLAVLTIVRELGITSSMVQAQELTPAQQDAYFWASVAVAQAAAVVLAIAAPFLAAFYDAPLLQPVLWACCVSLAVAGFGRVHAALLRRRLQYSRVAVIEGGGIACGLAAALAGAYAWGNVWALVAGHIASAVWMSVSALLLCQWSPGAPSRRPAKINLHFGFQVMVYDLLTYLGNNVGMVAGYRFGAAQLGYFNRAQQLCTLTYFTLLSPITDATFALLCRLKSEATYREAYVSVARKVWILFVPCATVLPIVSGDVVLALLGERWMPAAPVLAWFGPSVFGAALAALFEPLMLSQGRGRELRLFASGSLLLRGLGVAIGAQFGLAGLAAGFSLTTVLVVFPLMVWIGGRRGPVKARHQLAAMWPGLLTGAVATVAAVLAALAADSLGVAAGWARLAFVGGSAVLAWALVCGLLRPARTALFSRGLAREEAA